MAIRVSIRHHTAYHYERPVILSPHVFRLRPAAHGRTPVSAYSINITPARHSIDWQQDPFGNHLAKVVFDEPLSRELTVEVGLVAEMTSVNPLDFFIEDCAGHFPFEYDVLLKQELQPYWELRESGPLLLFWLELVDTSRRRTLDFLAELNDRLHDDIGPASDIDPGVQSCEETLAKGTGSCRDSAWLLVQILRHLGLAARFVSGYRVRLADDSNGPAQDSTELHAWAEAYLPGAGWVGLDPTSGLFADEGHIPLACTPDPSSAAAVSGCFIGESGCAFRFENSVSRIPESPH